MKNVAFHNLGCKTNAYEMDVMQQTMQDNGFHVVQFDQKSDVYVVNTCTVTNMADRKSRQMLHRAKQLNPRSVVVAVGCYVQTGREVLEADSAVDLLIGNNHKAEIAEIITEYMKNHGLWDRDESDRGDDGNEKGNRGNQSAGVDKSSHVEDINKPCLYEEMQLEQTAEHTRAYIKIQDGCNQFCSYCAIPYARGRVRSRSMDGIIKEITGLVEKGYLEVVLTGIHISSYGIDLEDEAWARGESKPFIRESEKDGHMVQDYSGESKLMDLLEQVCAIPGLKRVRLGSLEPRIVTEENGRRMSALPNLCPHFHLSLQSGCDATLERMNRHYTAEQFADSVAILRNCFEHPAITTDVIVGFPGETEEEFAASKAFLEKIAFYEMHVFKYSKRDGTRAATMPCQVSDADKNKRSDVLIALTEAQSKQFRMTYVGRTAEVLFEEEVSIPTQDGEENRYFVGHTTDYVKVALPIREETCQEKPSYENEILSVQVTGLLTDEILLGQLLP